MFPRRGRPGMEEIAVERSERCLYCGAEIVPPRKLYCTDDCRIEFYRLETREDVLTGNADWRLLWPGVRNKVLKRDNYTCQVCGFKGDIWGSNLEVHHIVPVHRGGKCLDPENLITLCRECHKQTFKKVNGYAGIPLRQLSLKDFTVIRHEMTGASDRPRAVTE